MNKIELKIYGLSYSHSQSDAYALILGEKGGNRRLPIIVGGSEAQAIAMEVEKMKPPRPLTHDLFKTFAQQFHVEVKEIIINKFVEGIFYAVLICTDGQREIEIDSRTSDAVAIALRFGCPIYTYESVIAVAGVVLDLEDDIIKDNLIETPTPDKLDQLSDEELQKMLDIAIENEDYEKASIIRDKIKNRKK